MVAAYDPGVLPAAQIAETQRLATSEHRGSLTVTAFDGDICPPLVLNAWGARQPCTPHERPGVGPVRRGVRRSGGCRKRRETVMRPNDPFGALSQGMLLAVMATALLVVQAAPALAHGGGGSDATNFRSTVLGLGSPAADDDAEPTPAAGADSPRFSWHDHRIHWMAATAPPQVKLDPGSEVLITRGTSRSPSTSRS
ncbi:MAG: hypothetical protein H0V93_05510 [Euzebyales bacterium]|nr:hypothetical protein [Euzebyales bacterium]